ncbi:MAG: phospho-N-acetylmuramoyl-pentapeptide-transferase [Bacteroidia bacterium]|nr:MAG: phospho-N-acetylmuramoyl-pentapeptide-transferase [Bacteroidia bacterium]PIE86414.1 MAG: phospho-N-acetylmuramoyl-pentapeptide-transferase [Bacteroidia bacterium]
MFYYLFHYLEQLDFPGAGLFQYISFRSGLAVISALMLSTIYGKRVIELLQKYQIGEIVRELDLEGQYAKKGTPTMGGIIIIGSILLPTLLFAKLENVYIILMIITTLWLGAIGFLDDYIKVFKKNKAGLNGKFKLLGQTILGIIVGLTLYFSDDVVIRETYKIDTKSNEAEVVESKDVDVANNDVVYMVKDSKSTKTTIPFVKKNEFDYAILVRWLGGNQKLFAWTLFIVVVILITTAVSNGANLTDGLDGLATGISAIVGATLGVLAYVSGNIIFSDYLNIMYIPFTGELVVFISAFIGATIGFLWYNSYPAQIFMGDTGSLTLGGIIAVFAIIIRKELLIPLLCGIFLVESLSVIIQVGWFKYTRKRFGKGRRVFKMSPLHHHYQKKGYSEPKLVTRFWIVGIFLAVITIITLKIR